MTGIQDLITRVRENKVLLKHIREDIVEKEGSHKILRQNTDSLIEDLSKYENIVLACKLILEKITYQNKIKLELFITNALQTIFSDRDYRLEVNIRDDLKRPSINLLLEESGKKQDIRDSVGGGIITTIGLLFQIYYLEVYGLNKILFIDEGLKEVSKVSGEHTDVNYLDNLLNFLKSLSRERDYRIVVITHDESVRAIADKVYRVNLGEVSEVRQGV